MIYILNIGYQSFAFASSRGLQTVLEALSKARQLESHYHPRLDCAEDLKLKDENPEVSLHVVNGVSFVKGRTKRDVIEPEVMPRQQRGESDAMFAMRAIKGRPSAVKTAQALSTIRRAELEGEFRRMLGEGK